VSYLGLHDNVRYRIEIGLAYIDDGATVHRFDDALFGELRAAVVATPADTDAGFAPVRALLIRFPSVFRAYDERPAAEHSFEAAELPEALA
jgi:hypothetical protein